ncbi:MAG TPA: hypothetical protein PLE12_02510 [Propionicimonas sp.]|jgi:hypothetical protein|nr:hypothetical protein [Propionicimonas sp.]
MSTIGISPVRSSPGQVHPPGGLRARSTADRIALAIGLAILRWARRTRAARHQRLLRDAAEDRTLRIVRARLEYERTVAEAMRVTPLR